MVHSEPLSKMVNLILNTSIRRTNRTNADRFLCRTWHLGSHADAVGMPCTAILRVVPSSKIKKMIRFSFQTLSISALCAILTVDLSSSIDFTQAADSMVHGRTVSVRPSRNKRVIDASYVNEKRPASR